MEKTNYIVGFMRLLCCDMFVGSINAALSSGRQCLFWSICLVVGSSGAFCSIMPNYKDDFLVCNKMVK